MERVTSHDITQIRMTASRNRASGVLDGDGSPVGPGRDRAAPATPDEQRSRRQLAALERVRRARLALAEAEADIERTIALLEMVGDLPVDRRDELPPLPPGVEPVDAERLEQVHADLERARRRSSRWGGGREVVGLEMAERLILERLGFADYEGFDQARREREAPVLDFAHLEFAQHELAQAEAAWQALLDGDERSDDGLRAGPAPLPVWQGPEGTGPSFDEVVGFADDLGIADVPTLDRGPADRGEVVAGADDEVGLLDELASDADDARVAGALDRAELGEPIELGPAADGHEVGDDATSSGQITHGQARAPLPKRVPRVSPTSPALPQRVRPDRRAAS